MGKDIVGVSDVFVQANNKKWSGQGRKARAYTSLAPDECVSLSESDIKTPDGPMLSLFSCFGLGKRVYES